MLNVVSLFDGISCGQVALQRAGIKVNKYYASEIDKYTIQVTQNNFPNTIQLGDVQKIKVSGFSKIDLLIGGSPCQGFSFAGKQLNFQDKRSKLFFEFVRILKEFVSETWPEPADRPKPEDDKTIFPVAWLHDTLEDTVAEYEDLKELFGESIADMVYLLSRNVNREEYKSRIKNSNYVVKIVKLADTLHNVHNPYSLSYLSEKGIQRKIDDCISFYIPLAMEICPSIGYKLKESVDNYLKIFRR